MLKKIMPGLIVFMFSVFGLIDEAAATPIVRLSLYPNVRTLTVGQDPQRIAITAEVDAANLRFAWDIQGPGTLDGSHDAPGRRYILPEQIEQPRTQVVITVTVTDANGEQASDHVMFTLYAATMSPPPPSAKKSRQTAALTVRSNVWGDMVSINGATYGATPLTQELPPGQYRIRVEKDGCLPYQETITLSANLVVRAILACSTPTPTRSLPPLPALTPTPTRSMPTPPRTPTSTPIPAATRKTRTEEIMQVSLGLDKPCGSTYRIGEKAVITFQANVDGYLILYDIDTRGRRSIVFPNKHSPENWVQANTNIVIPDRTYSYDLIIEGPPGRETLYAFFATNSTYYQTYANLNETLLDTITELKIGRYEENMIKVMCDFEVASGTGQTQDRPPSSRRKTE